MPSARARPHELSVVRALAVVTVVACSGYELELPRPGGLRAEAASQVTASPAVTLSRVVAAPALTEVVVAAPAASEAVAAPVVALEAPEPAPVAVVAPTVDEAPST